MNALVLLTALTSPGQCGTYYPRNYYPPVREVIVEKVIKEIPVAVYYPLAAVIPAYGGAYVPPVNVVPAPAPATPAVSPTATSDTAKILELLQGMDARLKAVEGKVGATPTTPTKPVDPFNPGGKTGNLETPRGSITDRARAIVSNKCAQCHDSTVAIEKGSGFSLLEAGNIAVLSAKEQKKMTFHILKGTMPKKPVPALTDDEASILLDYIDSLK